MDKRYFAIVVPNRFTGIIDDQEKFWELTRNASGYTSKTFDDINNAIDYLQEKTEDFKIEISDKNIPLFYVITKGFKTGVIKNFRDFKISIGDYPNPEYKRFQTLKEAITYWEKYLENNRKEEEKSGKIKKEAGNEKSLIMKDIRKKDKGTMKVSINSVMKEDEVYAYSLTYETPKLLRFKDVGIFNGNYEDLIFFLLDKVISNSAVNGYKEMTIQHDIKVPTLSKILKSNRKSFRKEVNQFVELDKYENLIGTEYKRIKPASADFKKGQELCQKILKLLVN